MNSQGGAGDSPALNINRQQIARRWFLQQCGVGLGAMALGQLLGASENPLAPKKPHFAPTAKSVIFLFMAGTPSTGPWVTYGLASESQDLPAFVVSSSGKKGPGGGDSCWGSGFLPTVYQGVQFRGTGDPVLYLSNPRGVDAELQRDSLDTLRSLNQARLEATGDPEIATRINSFEMAFRMQSSAPELMDLSKEPKNILEMYGAEPGKPSFANNCLLARRLVERGVRFVQLFHESWDQHGNLVADLKKNCGNTDKASAALVKDLKQRGLLKDRPVIWG